MDFLFFYSLILAFVQFISFLLNIIKIITRKKQMLLERLLLQRFFLLLLSCAIHFSSFFKYYVEKWKIAKLQNKKESLRMLDYVKVQNLKEKNLLSFHIKRLMDMMELNEITYVNPDSRVNKKNGTDEKGKKKKEEKEEKKCEERKGKKLGICSKSVIHQEMI